MPNYSVYADNREALKNYIRQFIGSFAVIPHAPRLEITMPCCGMRRVYRREIDIPVNDVGPCPCGNWLIKYKEQPFQVMF